MAVDDPLLSPNEQSLKISTVTYGWTSFVGRSLVSSLLKSGNWTVRIADPLPPPELITDPTISNSIQSGRASYIQVDFTDQSNVRAAVEGSSVVFHMDSAAASSRDFYHLYMITVQATKNVIRACWECGVERLVYTGLADVVFDGVHDVHDGDESLLYPERFENVSNELRAQVERQVLDANGKNGLSTCALRPSNPFGPGDDYLVPLLVSQAKSRWAKFIIESGKNMCDFTYVENVAYANICAEQVLCSGVGSVAGETFFITNQEPAKLWEFISSILEGLGYQRPRIHLPAKLVLLIVMQAKRIREKLGLCRTDDPFLTPAFVSSLSCTKTFNCSKAQRIIGYSPLVSLEDGVRLTIESFSQLAKDLPYLRLRDFSKPSKAETLLGGGEVGDVLLWRNEKRTFTYLVALFLSFYWLLLSGRTLISSIAKLLLLVSVILFAQGLLPSSMFGLTVEKVPLSYFEVSELAMRYSFIILASIWNRSFRMLKSVAQGDDWNIFIKMTGCLYVIKLLLPVPLSVLIGLGLIFFFTIFIVYEQYEEEVDQVMTITTSGLKKLKDSFIAKLPGALVMSVHKS